MLFVRSGCRTPRRRTFRITTAFPALAPQYGLQASAIRTHFQRSDSGRYGVLELVDQLKRCEVR